MSRTSKAVTFAGGFVVGVLGEWAFQFLYATVTDAVAGSFVVPLALVVAGALLLAREPQLRPFAWGVAAGAAATTVFFYWFTNSLS